MAEIPVERDKRSGIPGWVWLLAAGLLAGLAGLAMWSRNRATPVDTSANPVMPAVAEPAPGTALVPTAAVNHAGQTVIAPTVVPTAQPRSDGGTLQAATTGSGEVLVDVGAYGAASDKTALIGRRVEFSNVRVTRVLSDRVFTVTSGTGELFAMLDDGLNAGAIEQRVVVQAGQLLDVQGALRRVPDAETVDEQSRPIRLAPGAAEAMRDQQAYLHVTVIRGSAVR